MHNLTDDEVEMTVAWLRSCRNILETLTIGWIGRWIFGKKLEQVKSDLTKLLDMYERKRYVVREA